VKNNEGCNHAYLSHAGARKPNGAPPHCFDAEIAKRLRGAANEAAAQPFPAKLCRLNTQASCEVTAARSEWMQGAGIESVFVAEGERG